MGFGAADSEVVDAAGADVEWSCAPQGPRPHGEGVEEEWTGREGSDAGRSVMGLGSEGGSCDADEMPFDQSGLSVGTGSEKSSTGSLSVKSGAGEDVFPGCGVREA